MTRPTFGPGEDEPSAPQLPPSAHTMGQADYSALIWHQLRDLQAALAELQGSFSEVKVEIRGIKSTIDSTKAKVDDLVNWKNRIIGGVIVLGVVVAVVWALATKMGDYIIIKPQTPAPSVIK